jgi:hypothetical protein
MEPPQLDMLEIVEVAKLEMVMVSHEPDMPLEQAMGDGYLQIDWGLSVSLQHRRLYPDASEPIVADRKS